MSHAIDSEKVSHIINDYEIACTAASRRLANATDLLTNALHALNNGSPHVTAEYLDRALADVKHALTALHNR